MFIIYFVRILAQSIQKIGISASIFISIFLTTHPQNSLALQGPSSESNEQLSRPHSPSRHSQETREQARLRHLRSSTSSPLGGTENGSVYDSQTVFGAMKLDQIPELGNLRTLQEVFLRLRDTRSWRWNRMPDFPRRLMWIFPSDGCYLRTAMMNEKLQEWGVTSPKNIFIFGELSFANKYQQMTWWYHVAPAYRLGNQVYILDPAIQPKGPMKLQEWILSMTRTQSDSTYALCEAGAINPYDECAQKQSGWDFGERTSTLQEYLGKEWTGLEEALGHSPAALLGEHPPWQQLFPQTNK